MAPLSLRLQRRSIVLLFDEAIDYLQYSPTASPLAAEVCFVSDDTSHMPGPAWQMEVLQPDVGTGKHMIRPPVALPIEPEQEEEPMRLPPLGFNTWNRFVRPRSSHSFFFYFPFEHTDRAPRQVPLLC